MFKYTRLNKINHYHDSRSHQQAANSIAISHTLPASVISSRKVVKSSIEKIRDPENRTKSRALEKSCNSNNNNNNSSRTIKNIGKMRSSFECPLSDLLTASQDQTLTIGSHHQRSQSILSTKSLTNLITINRKPLEPGDRRRKQREKQQQQQQQQLQQQQYQCQNQLQVAMISRVASGCCLVNSKTLSSRRASAARMKGNDNSSNRQTFKVLKLSSSQASAKQQLKVQTRRSAKLSSSSLVSLIGLLTLMLVLCLQQASQVQSLSCYQCSSADDPGCDEAFTSRVNYTSNTKCLIPQGTTVKVCRKIIQYVEHKKVVIRSCGYIDDHEKEYSTLNAEELKKRSQCVKRSGTFAIMMESCICYEDNCNHSASLVPNLHVLIILPSVCSFFVLLFYSKHHPTTIQ